MNRTSRTVSVSDPLWTALETMSREMGVDRDVLLNQAIFSLARQFGFITPTQVSLLDGTTAAAPRAPEPVQPVSAPVVQPPVEVARTTEGSEVAVSAPKVATDVGPASVTLEEAEPSETEAVLAAIRPEPEAPAPQVDVEALRPAVVARIRDILADVDRLVEPVNEQLREEAEDSEDEDDSDDEDVSDDDESSEDEGASDDDEGSDEDEEGATGDNEVTDDGASGVGAFDDDDDSPSEGGGLPVPTPKPPAPLETTIVVKTTSGVPLHVKLDDSEPVRVSRERFVIGRGAHCDLVVKSARVSREHAAVVREGAEYFIEDLTSSNGTWFDNTRIARRLVSDGEEYLLGGIRVTFSLG
ncbi:FHA domain-containing protein [Pyxidicoccus parkwayensis]|uniref:FHA domain-containing protein n=1 Tax=Pyxidicoccus parkwayensis TaxID=2813578 RepID=A0ABX7P898_9BACT|nr:FHA domain-containing protein [Pyxidicoccus parkwaysis]QSQ26688.1 FHA domain-containing protein [Pyxidicoccus parkwaysis]